MLERLCLLSDPIAGDPVERQPAFGPMCPSGSFRIFEQNATFDANPRPSGDIGQNEVGGDNVERAVLAQWSGPYGFVRFDFPRLRGRC